jgi:hypothetical protein
MDRRPIKVAAVAPGNKIARVAWNEEIGQELHTVPFIRLVAQLEASILDLNLMLRTAQQATQRLTEAGQQGGCDERE